MDDDFDTVAISYSQPEVAVILSFLAWHDIPAYAQGDHVRVAPNLITALGGIPIRVPRAVAAEARALLATVPPPAPGEPPRPHRGPGGKLAVLLFALFGGGPPPPPVRADLT